MAATEQGKLKNLIIDKTAHIMAGVVTFLLISIITGAISYAKLQASVDNMQATLVEMKGTLKEIQHAQAQMANTQTALVAEDKRLSDKCSTQEAEINRLRDGR